MQALIVALGFLAAYEAVVEGQVQFISNETIFGTYDADIELPSCWSYYEIKGCRFVKRYLGFMDNWKEYGYWNFDDPDDMHPGETIDCSQTNDSLYEDINCSIMNSTYCQLNIENGRKIRHEGDWTCEIQIWNNTWINSTNSVSLEFKNDPRQLISNAIEEIVEGFMQGLEEIYNLVQNFD